MLLAFTPKPSIDARVPIVPFTELEDLALPLYHSVQAGFPSPADDHAEEVLNLQELLVRDSACTFMVRVEGESMIGAGIHPGDVMVVDRSIEAAHGDVVVAFINNEYTVKRLCKQPGFIELRPENPVFEPIQVQDGDELIIWGVVTTNLRMIRKP
jgi:DNA polymerase V